jgi:hypothetical protein
MATPGKVVQIIPRDDGSEVRITAEKWYGLGLTCSIKVFAHRRESRQHSWTLASDTPHPEWRKMSVDDYIKRGRSEMLQTVSHAEILKVTSALVSPGM